MRANFESIGPFLLGIPFGIAPYIGPVSISGKITYFEAILSIIVCAIILIKRKVHSPRKLHEGLALLLNFWVILSWAFFSLRRDLEINASLFMFRQLYFLGLMLAIPTLIQNNQYIIRALYGLLFGLMITLFWGWFVWFISPRFYDTGIPMYHVIFDVPEGWEINRNYSGYFVLITFAIALGVVQRLKFKVPIIFFVGVTGLFTFSKGTWLGLFVIALGSYITSPILYNTQKKIISAFLSMIVFACFLLVSFRFDLHRPFIEKILTSQEQISQRWHLISDSYHVIKNFPIFGSGPGTFKEASAQYGYWGKSADPHNTLLWLASEVGIFSAVLFLLIIIATIWKSYKKASHKNGLPETLLNRTVFLFLLMLLSQLPLHGLPYSMSSTWFILGVVGAIRYTRTRCQCTH
ncbi:O-antigen ligase family protein [Chromohalobacter sp. 296-RDG]|uniref:O-antigen ligase family protein n=1 Tax=Chromohalobacter sp. 296-RDG TaxID=2994062 RepID=UPI0024698F09|nr:O-antigen ligase family protein [Chromohalobacter sp. 296-RDG]